MIRAFDLAIRQLGDPRLRGIIWQSLALSLVLQIAIGVVAWWVLQSFATFQWNWLNETIRWLGGGAVAVLALMLFPASFGIVISIFLEQIADIAERFSRVEEIYHDIRVIEVTLEPARMGDVTEDLLRELSDTTHPAFYARNQHELDHIDLDRVKEAVQRLAAVEPLRFRVEISRRMMGLLEEETDPELRADLCSALKV